MIRNKKEFNRNLKRIIKIIFESNKTIYDDTDSFIEENNLNVAKQVLDELHSRGVISGLYAGNKLESFTVNVSRLVEFENSLKFRNKIKTIFKEIIGFIINCIK